MPPPFVSAYSPVTVSSDAVVGAGAVVTRDVAPRAVVAGNPPRVLRRMRAGERAR
ncbi:MAG TPA: hypothetical protein VGB42_11930 [Candidatus Thermoplasmatota archaeon]